MRRPLLYSLLFHLAIVLLVAISLFMGPRKLPEEQPISVQIVTAPPSRAQVKQAPPAAEAAPVPKREASAPNPSQETKRAQAVSPPKPADIPVPEQRPVVAEEEPEPEPAPTPAPKVATAKPEPAPSVTPPAPRPAEKPVEAPKEAPSKPQPPVKTAAPEAKPQQPKEQKQAAATPATKPPPAKKAETKTEAKQAEPDKKPDTKPAQNAKSKDKEDSFDALLKSVSETPKRTQQAESRKASGTSSEVATNKAGDAPPAASAEEIAGLIASAQRQMNRCWSINPGTPGANEVGSFKVDVKLRKDGTASAVTLLDRSLLGSPASRAIAESATRAAWSCKLTLPAELYDRWQDIQFSFDPKQAMAG